MQPDSENLMNLVRRSAAHFMAPCEINGKAFNMIVDSGGARTLMDITVAKRLGLPIDKATKKKKYGSYWGAGGEETFYWGRVRGPIEVKIHEGTMVTIDEIKIIEHGEPLFLWGTDMLCDSETSEWRFCWVGLHPVERVGMHVYVNARNG